jgi:hypothetical protein
MTVPCREDYGDARRSSRQLAWILVDKPPESGPEPGRRGHPF